jgi:hypothetical protein
MMIGASDLVRTCIQETCKMSDLVVVAFPTEAKAEEVRQKLLAMQKEYLIELGDAVIAVKDANGNVKLNQLINTTAAGGSFGDVFSDSPNSMRSPPLVNRPHPDSR